MFLHSLEDLEWEERIRMEAIEAVANESDCKRCSFYYESEEDI